MLHPVVVVGEGLARVERRVDVDEFDLATVVACVLGNLAQDAQHVEAVAGEEKVVTVRVVFIDFSVRDGEVGQPDFACSGVVRLDPDRLTRLVLGDEQKLVLARPHQFESRAHCLSTHPFIY